MTPHRNAFIAAALTTSLAVTVGAAAVASSSEYDPKPSPTPTVTQTIHEERPGSKMASAGSDWRTNTRTQIRWGISYIKSRYGTPCGAWNHSQQKGWY